MTESGVEVPAVMPTVSVRAKPFFAQIGGRLDVMNPRAKTRTGFDQLVRVVAVRAADDDDHVAFLRQFNRRVLPLFRRLADRVNETHFRFGKPFANQSHEPPDFVNRLRRLRNDAESRTLAKLRHVFLAKHHVEFGQDPPSCRALPRGRVCR